MKTLTSQRYLFAVLILCSFAALSQEKDDLLKVMKEELTREMLELKKSPNPPYYISYRVNEVYNATIKCSFGSLIFSNSEKNRILNVSARVGDYNFDNTHPLEPGGNMDRWQMMNMERSIPSVLPIENNSKALKFYLWSATTTAYRAASEGYKIIKSPTSKVVTSTTPDYSTEQPSVYYEPPIDPENLSDRKKWEDQTRKLSSLFLENNDLVTGDVSFHVMADRKYFLSSEGSVVAQNSVQFYVYVDASIRADDGDILPLHKSYFAFAADALPSAGIIENDIRSLIKKLEELKHAPLAEPYSGPAILHAQTAGVFFHEIFGHRVEGHRLKSESDGQTFKTKIGEQVLPASLSVVFDPTMDKLNSQFLNGFYRYDDEGVKAERVVSVEKGILRNFLMSRTPLDHFQKSNGHGRAAAGANAVSRQSNLLVQTSKGQSMSDLRKMLIKECKRQGKKYGYLFNQVVGGFTNTERFVPNAFNIFPTEVYRIYVDGKADELVRGVDLIGTPLAMFAEIAATGDEADVFHGFCGAESGSVPVSVVSPALFVKRIETQKKPKTLQDSTLLTRPTEN